jgi:heme-degrading monooxygenase HmoA
MVISVTTSKVTPELGREVEEFLSGFLPRLKAEQPGVVAIYHFTKPDQGEEVTAIIWESDEARAAYRESELIKEALAVEQRLGLASTREAYPLALALPYPQTRRRLAVVAVAR